jgi:hypothetical protein
VTRPPEYEQVAQWLRAIKDDPELLRELTSEYHGIKYAIEDGLTLGRYIGERRQLLAECGRRALAGIDLDGKTTARIAAEYHAGQVAGCAHLVRDLEERIRALQAGDFPVPAWCAEDAVRDGISLAEAIERYRQDEIDAATQALDHLDEYAVGAREIQAYRAGRDSRADYDGPGNGRPAAAGRPGQGRSGSRLDSAGGPELAGPGLMSARAASSAVRPGRAAASSPGTAVGITGPQSRTSLDFPNTVTQGIPARPAAPRRPVGQPGRPVARRTS